MATEIISTIQGFLTPAHIGQRIAVQKPVTTAIRDWMYPNRVPHPFAQIGMDEVKKVIKNVPVVRRGTKAVPINTDSQSMTLIEPQGIDVADQLSATEINNMKMLSNTSIEQMVNNKTDHMMKTVTKTSEALCAQSLSGRISYPMKTEGGMDVYEVDFGDTQTYTPAKKWDASGITIADVYTHLSDMQTQLEEAGFGSKIEFKAGKKAFQTLLMLADGANNKAIKVEVKEDAIIVGGITVMKEAGVYEGIGGNAVAKVEPHKIVACDVEAGHGYWWLALDDIRAGLVPLPFFPSHEITNNPSQMEIVGRSKPFPGPIVDAICWAEVTAQ